ncbi:hypothetical protein H8D85_02540 [bacterium]|nr:hypothetical protein [bacterium]
MPEETINYKVNIDASDVSSQLDAIRSQIDGAIGAMSIGLGAGASPSFASPISTAPEVQLSPYNTINAITNRFNDQAMFSSQSGATGLGAFVEGTSEAFNLGYSKMSSGMRQMGMLSEMPPLVNYPSTGVDPFTLNMEMLSGAPMFSSSGTPGSSSALGGSLGFG